MIDRDTPLAELRRRRDAAALNRGWAPWAEDAAQALDALIEAREREAGDA